MLIQPRVSSSSHFKFERISESRREGPAWESVPPGLIKANYLGFEVWWVVRV